MCDKTLDQAILVSHLEKKHQVKLELPKKRGYRSGNYKNQAQKVGNFFVPERIPENVVPNVLPERISESDISRVSRVMVIEIC